MQMIRIQSHFRIVTLFLEQQAKSLRTIPGFIPSLGDNQAKSERKAVEAAMGVKVLGVEDAAKHALRERPVTPSKLYEVVK